MAENGKKVVGTQDMPAVETLNYDTVFKVSNVFVNDLKIVLKDVAYADAKKYFDFLEHYEYELPIAVLNEFLKKLADLPYRFVNPLFQIIQNKDLFPKYFIDITAQQKPIPNNLSESEQVAAKAKNNKVSKTK